MLLLPLLLLHRSHPSLPPPSYCAAAAAASARSTMRFNIVEVSCSYSVPCTRRIDRRKVREKSIFQYVYYSCAVASQLGWVFRCLQSGGEGRVASAALSATEALRPTLRAVARAALAGYLFCAQSTFAICPRREFWDACASSCQPLSPGACAASKRIVGGRGAVGNPYCG